MEFDDYQLEAIRAFTTWLSTMDASSLVDTVDRLNETETDGEFRDLLASIDANEDP